MSRFINAEKLKTVMAKDLVEETSNEMLVLNFSCNPLTTHPILTQYHLLEIEIFALSKIGQFLDIKLSCIVLDFWFISSGYLPEYLVHVFL